MAKKDLILGSVQKHLLGLKALIGLNVIINLYIDESEMMMMVSFHKIERYKDLPPLHIQFTESDFKDDQVIINTTIAGQVKMYIEGRLNMSDVMPKSSHVVPEETKNYKDAPPKPNHAIKTIRTVTIDGEIE